MDGIVAGEPAGDTPISFHNREVEYPIDRIIVGPRKRNVQNTEKVAAIAQSMAELGLINAISLLPDGTLITGNHRIAAARLLGWTTIRAIIKEIDEIDARLNEIDENLFREDLTVLQQAEHIAEREEILRAKGLRAPAHRPEKGVTVTPLTTTADIGQMMGLSESSIQKRKQIAAGVAPEVKEKIGQTELANSTTQLLALANMAPEKQGEVADLIVAGRCETVKQAESLLSWTSSIAPHVSHNSGVNEWYTPSEYIEAAREVMGRIDLDPASCALANQTVGARRYFSAMDDGLDQQWVGNVWMNPPYSAGLIDRFCEKFSNHVLAGDIEHGIVLVNNATETEWFGFLVGACDAVLFPRSRVRFLRPDGAAGAPLQGQAVLYAGPNVEGFLSVFGSFGWGATL